MMPFFLLASSNEHKAAEFQKLFTTLSIQPVTENIPVEETGKTFQENALIKALAYYQKYKTPVMSDDSGLVIVDCPHILGVHTARYAPECPDNISKNQKLLVELKDLKNRKCYFVSQLCFYLGPDEIYFFEGRLDGELGTQFSGEYGFGYDPIFYPTQLSGQSLADDPDWKMIHSHRAKACQMAEKFFSQQNLFNY